MSSTAISRLIHPFIKDRFLHALLLAGVAMFAFHPQPLTALGGFIDGRTL
ncbi:anion transporter, partial [Enterobacteriaceae bacterium 8376wG6]|nr:anion transporter [Enterobacteriaceae bacterium 8376wG6]